MAYAYSNLNESTTTLSRKGKGADQDADILREFKVSVKLSEHERQTKNEQPRAPVVSHNEPALLRLRELCWILVRDDGGWYSHLFSWLTLAAQA
jgi:hypothetical protein